MNERRVALPPDDVIRAALTLEPSTGLANAVGRDLAVRLATTPQRRPILPWWPWQLGLPGLAPSASQRRLRSFAILLTLGLLVALSIAVIGLIGSIHRLPAPFGLARPGLIAFDSSGDIVVANLDGTGRRHLTSGTESDIQPTFSPNGSKLAFLSLAIGGATVELVVMDVDGSHRTTIASNPAVGFGQSTSIQWRLLSWSPDSRSLAYTAFAEGRPQIFVAQADGTGSALIGDRTLEGQDPTWSPDGLRLAFRGGRFDKDRGVYVMDADGSNVRRLTTRQEDPAGNAYAYFAPAWSPDGTWIAYTKVLTPEVKQVWVVGVDNGAERAISNATEWNDSPTWSPDGSRLAYFTIPASASSGGRFVVVNPDGSGEIVLPGSVGGPPAGDRGLPQSGSKAPTWSPDGAKLVGRSYEAAFPYLSSITVIDIALRTSIVVQSGGSPGGSSSEIQGAPSWQRLAD